MTATNTGQVPITNAVLTDDLSDVLGAGKATLGSIAWGRPTGTMLGPVPTYSSVTELITGTITSLAAGSSVSMLLRRELDPRAYDQILTNSAWGNSTPAGPPEECTQAVPCEIEHMTPAGADPHAGQAGRPAVRRHRRPGGVVPDRDRPSWSAWRAGQGAASGDVWSGVAYTVTEVPSAAVADGWTVDTTWACVDDPAPGQGGGFDIQPPARGVPPTERGSR